MSYQEFLRKIPLFADLPEPDLLRLCSMVKEVRVEAGELLFAEGSQGTRAYIIQQGELEILKASGGREVLIAVRKPGEVIGEISLLQASPRTASVRARTDAVLLSLEKEQLDELLHTSSTALQAMFHTVLSRWRGMEAMLRQSEKLAQLGTLTAGVAHELNNPASAVQRASGQLEPALQGFQRACLALSRLELDADQSQALEAATQRALALSARPPVLEALARSDRESELEAWLEQRGLADPWEQAPLLVNLDYDVARLEALAQSFPNAQLPVILTSLTATYSVHNLLAEIGAGVGRISQIVKALKTYSYLDQAPVQAVDVREGLEDTLLILRSKLEGISVRREYAPDLPRIQGYGSELNQVWTNLIDNAAYAVDGIGEIVLRTRREGDFVIVEVQDNGPGIPAEIKDRIFDPFFTTKPVGQGTGLGLDISYNIVVNKHRGDIQVSSEPGRTVFEVRLPLNFEAR
ncbi:MAG TPA: ATP-binding protein [Anaerolineales bacterium]|nr:ATP-binding protein [Anaerolineales bacterium]